MNTDIEQVAIIPFFIPDVGVAYFVGPFKQSDICLDECDDDFAFRHNVLNEEMEVFFSEEGVISWFEKNGFYYTHFFCEFGRDFLNKGFWILNM